MKQVFRFNFVLSFLMILLGSQVGRSQSIGVNSIVITFDSAPTSYTLSKAPLKYNKEFALSFHLNNAIKETYTHAFQLLNGGSISGTTYPGLFYTDGCGNDLKFKMSTSLFSFAIDGETDIHNPSNATYNSAYASWAELTEIYNAGWGIFNKGLLPDNSGDKSYSFSRNHSYVKRNTQSAIENGIDMKVLVSPENDSTFTRFAFDNDYHISYSTDYSTGIPRVKTSDLSQLDTLRLGSNSMNSGQSIAQFADSLYANSSSVNHYWGSTFSNRINDGISEGYSFIIFKFYMEYLESTYGKGGLDNFWFTTEEEIQNYLKIKQLVTVTEELAGNKLLLTFSGTLPTDLRNYALSLTLSSDANVDTIVINGGGTHTTQITNDTTALINLNWEGFIGSSLNDLTETYVSIAESSKALNDALIALDYVNMIEAIATKTAFLDRICAIAGITLPDGYCSCEVSLGNDTTLCLGSSILLTAPEGDSYLWSSAETTQEITFTTSVDSSVFIEVVNEFGCSSNDTISISIETVPTVVLSNDTLICPGDTVSITASGGVSYLWETGETTATISVNPTSSSYFYVDVFNAAECYSRDSVYIGTYTVSGSAEQDVAICYGDCTSLTATGGYGYLWDTGDTTNIIEVCPTNTSSYIVEISNLNGCTVKDTVTVNVRELPVANAGDDQSICRSTCVDLGASGGLTYLWSNGIEGDTIEVCPTVETTYFVEVTDQYACSAIDSVTISIKQSALFEIDGLSSVYCEGASANLLEGNPAGGTFGGNGISGNIFSPTEAGIGVHQITYTAESDGCNITDTFNVSIYANPVILFPIDTIYCVDETVEFFITAGYDSYLWSDGGSNYYHSVDSTGTGYGTLALDLIVTDNGCVSMSSINISFVSCIIGIDDLEKAGISIYPNPSSGLLNLKLVDHSEDVLVKITNVQGQVVFSQEIESCGFQNCTQTLDLYHLKKGLYIIQFSNKDFFTSGKLFIQ